MKQVRTLTGDQKHKSINKKLTQKQWLVYYYMLSICNWNGIDKEDHYYLYKNQINIAQASRVIKISRPTFYAALEKLSKAGIITDKDLKTQETLNYYLIEIPKIYAAIDQKTLSFLLPFQKVLGVDLIRTYVLLCRIYQHPEIDNRFTKVLLIDILGHNKSDTSYYELMELILSFLVFEGLIEVTSKTITDAFGHHKEYLLKNVHSVSDQVIVDNSIIDEKLVKKIKEIMETEGLWGIED